MRLHPAVAPLERCNGAHCRAVLLRLRVRTMSALIFAVLTSGGRAALAQQPAQTPPSLGGYRPPSLVLVQPAGGGSVPQDRPAIMFRFAAGDSTDPIEARSFGIVIDGKDRTALFQLARDEVWGPLAPAEELSSLTAGAHVFSARICSIRGACSEVTATVTVVASAAAMRDQTTDKPKRSVLDLLLAAARKLLNP